MIDYTKPVRWVNDKAVAEVIVLTHDGGAWILCSTYVAYKYDRVGCCSGSERVENFPESIVSWVVVYQDHCCVVHTTESSALEFFKRSHARLAVLKLTYTPGEKPTVELIEERK